MRAQSVHPERDGAADQAWQRGVRRFRVPRASNRHRGTWGYQRVVAASFTGEYPQRIDGKGRMSIPADFRKVLEAGHPSRDAGELPSLYLLYGAHLRDHLQAFTVQAFAEVAERIAAIRPRTPEEAERKAVSSRLILGQSVRLELDRDGRVVMPAARRAQLGLTEGEVVFSGAGDHFEIWAASTYEEAVGARMRAFLDAQGDGFDPMTLVWSLGA